MWYTLFYCPLHRTVKHPLNAPGGHVSPQQPAKCFGDPLSKVMVSIPSLVYSNIVDQGHFKKVPISQKLLSDCRDPSVSLCVGSSVPLSCFRSIAVLWHRYCSPNPLCRPSIGRLKDRCFVRMCQAPCPLICALTGGGDPCVVVKSTEVLIFPVSVWSIPFLVSERKPIRGEAATSDGLVCSTRYTRPLSRTCYSQLVLIKLLRVCFLSDRNSFHTTRAKPFGPRRRDCRENTVSDKWNPLMCTKEHKALQMSLFSFE